MPAETPIRRDLAQIAALSATAFLLHLVWEYAQCSLFFVHGSVPPTNQSMGIATLGDLAATWIVYGAVAIKKREWPWRSGGWSKGDVFLASALGIGIAIAIELQALSTGRWSYRETMPLVPGTAIAALPLIQMAVLVPLSFRLAKRR